MIIYIYIYDTSKVTHYFKNWNHQQPKNPPFSRMVNIFYEKERKKERKKERTRPYLTYVNT